MIARLTAPWPAGAMAPDPRTRLRAPALLGLAVLAAIAFGAALPENPRAAVALVALVPLALGAPVASLGVLLVLTVVVPFDVQNRLSFVGGENVPGLLIVDLLVFLGLCRAALLVGIKKLRVETPLVVAAALGLVLAGFLVEGVVGGADLSEAGHEARRLGMGVAGFILAWPILGRPASRRALYGLLLALGLILGVWGLAQWFFSIDFTAGADVGVRPGVELTSGGRGSLQGGLYAFPVAVTLAFTALVAHRVRSVEVRILLAAILLLNGICLLLTYERTFWLAAGLGCLMAAVRSGPEARRRALGWAALGGVTLLVSLAALGELQTAAERLTSVTKYGTDESLEFRQVETRHVAEQIAERPLTGSGLGATITWGKEGVFAEETTPFSHNGYLWLAWKLGLPATIFLVLLIGVAVIRSSPAGDERLRMLHTGSQASLLALLVIGVTFPPFNAFGITALMGVLAAVCLQPRSATHRLST
jgi:hypothetical protein